ncbi:hypothetical protein BU16DRAFT_563262 [Lophium mytilinum]|uniref:Uncharacterized protein n=1 Tax=Lophium mytilinum TaxID=390894 RepID=A0A6A6QQB7_9PEZI|nr:hypothetical protein BU16DRAFT_563262 [Lophium mytilinum]
MRSFAILAILAMALLGVLPTTTIAQSTRVTTIFVAYYNYSATYNARVIDAQPTAITYVLDDINCNPNELPPKDCVRNVTATYGLSWYQEEHVDVGGLASTDFIHCDLEGTTAVVVTISSIAPKYTTVEQWTESAMDDFYQAVTITDGLEKLASITGGLVATSSPTPTPTGSTSITSLLYPNNNWDFRAASVVGSSNSSVTYAFASFCNYTTESATDGDGPSGYSSCLMQPGGFTATFGASFYEERTSATDDHFFLSRRCEYEGSPTNLLKTCTQGLKDGDGSDLAQKDWESQRYGTTDGGFDGVTMRAVTITAGLEKLAAETGSRSGITGTPTSTVTGTAASSTSKAVGGKAVEISIAGAVGIALAAFVL